MKKLNMLAKLLSIFVASFVLLFVGCQDSTLDPIVNETTGTSDTEALQQIADEDSALASFEPNYNEEEAMTFLGKTQTAIFPLRVGQKVRLVNRNLNVDFQGDSAFGTLTRTFEGTLFIAASYDSVTTHDSSAVDTIIQKPFTSVITTKLIFKKVDNTDNPKRNWRLVAISLPEGGTQSPNIDITKLILTYENGEVLEITSPNDYFLSRGRPVFKQIPTMRRNQDINVKVELNSAYAEDDFVTLTYGADHRGRHRAKKRFELISSLPNGNGYTKVYEQTFRTHQFPGYYHAIINAFPRQVIFDDAAPVESESWGIPYIIKF